MTLIAFILTQFLREGTEVRMVTRLKSDPEAPSSSRCCRRKSRRRLSARSRSTGDGTKREGSSNTGDRAATEEVPMVFVGKSGYKPQKASALRISKEVCSDTRFWRFFTLIILLVGVRIVFRHLDATFPAYVAGGCFVSR